MIYELLNEGYFDAVKKSSINIEDTKSKLIANKITQFKEDYANPDGVECTYIYKNNILDAGGVIPLAAENRFTMLISNILWFSLPLQKKDHINIYEYSYKHNNPETDKPLFIISHDDIINANFKLLSGGTTEPMDYIMNRVFHYCTCKYDLDIISFNSDAIYIDLCTYFEDGMETFLAYNYFKFFKTIYEQKFGTSEIDLRNKTILNQFYDNIDEFLHNTPDVPNKYISKMSKILKELIIEIINASVALNMTYNEILDDIQRDHTGENIDYITKNNKIFQYILFESEAGKKLIFNFRNELLSLKTLLEEKIDVPVIVSLNFMDGKGKIIVDYHIINDDVLYKITV